MPRSRNTRDTARRSAYSVEPVDPGQLTWLLLTPDSDGWTYQHTGASIQSVLFSGLDGDNIQGLRMYYELINGFNFDLGFEQRPNDQTANLTSNRDGSIGSPVSTAGTNWQDNFDVRGALAAGRAFGFFELCSTKSGQYRFVQGSNSYTSSTDRSVLNWAGVWENSADVLGSWRFFTSQANGIAAGSRWKVWRSFLG